MIYEYATTQGEMTKLRDVKRAIMTIERNMKDIGLATIRGYF